MTSAAGPTVPTVQLSHGTRRLGVSYSDLFIIHWPNPGLGQFTEAMKGLEALRADGHPGVGCQPRHRHRGLEPAGPQQRAAGNPARLKENISIFDITLEDEDLHRISSLDRGETDILDSDRFGH